MPDTSGTVWTVLAGEVRNGGGIGKGSEAYSNRAKVGGLVRGLRDRRL